MSDTGQLTDKQRQFVAEYLVDFNGAQAAIRAGYSENTARSTASENLTKPDIVAAIQQAIEERSQRTQITQDMVLQELAKIGFADIRKAVKWGAKPLPSMTGEGGEESREYPVELVASEEIDDDTAAAVSEVSLTTSGVKIKMYDKKSALDSIGKHLGMFTEKVEHSGPGGKPIEVSTLTNKEMARQLAFLLTSGMQDESQ